MAGQLARSRQLPSYPPSGVLQEFFNGAEPAVADFHIRAITSWRAGLSRPSAAAEMSRGSGEDQAARTTGGTAAASKRHQPERRGPRAPLPDPPDRQPRPPRARAVG